MSGSFEDLDVPPTLVSFATAVGSVEHVTSPEFKGAGHRVLLVGPDFDSSDRLPDVPSLLEAFDLVERLIREGAALSASALGFGGLAESVFKACVGNRVGIALDGDVFDHDGPDLFEHLYGSFLVELADGAEVPRPTGADVWEIGATTEAYQLSIWDETVDSRCAEGVGACAGGRVPVPDPCRGARARKGR